MSIATLEKALELGHNFLDTADYYLTGHNEELISKAIKANVKKLFSLLKQASWWLAALTDRWYQAL